MIDANSAKLEKLQTEVYSKWALYKSKRSFVSVLQVMAEIQVAADFLIL